MLVTVDNIKEALQNTEVVETFIEQIIKGITGQIENFCDRGLVYATRTEDYSIDGSKVRKVKLRAYPVWSLTYVKDGTTESPAGDDITNNLRFDQDTGIVYYPEGYFTEGWRNVEIKYVAGWDTEETGKKPPEDLKLAIIDEVCARYELHMSEPLPAEGVNPFQRSKDLSEKCKQALLPYKRISYS